MDGIGRPVAIVGPHPPLRGGIAHFTERVAAEVEHAGREVIPVSFRRLYPGALFPGRSQYEPGTKPGAGTGEWIDSIGPRSWTRAAEAIIAGGAEAAVFMYWMPFFGPAFTSMAKRIRKAGIRRIAVVHNALPHERHVGDAFLTARFLRACDAILVLSESVAADVRVLAPGIPTRLHGHPLYDRFGDAVNRAVAREKLELDEDAQVMLFFGNVRRYKGLDVLIDAMPVIVKGVPKAVLLVAGEFYEDAETYQARIRRTNVQGHVRLFDRYVPTEDVSIFFSAADVVVQPYRAATQSGVIGTAHHFGVPVIATSVGSLEEEVGLGGVVVPPEDPAALAQAVLAFFAGSRKPGSGAGVERDAHATTWQTFVAALLEEIDRTTR
jgi:glycosyltransferase involved in cell wall biosynthesis